MGAIFSTLGAIVSTIFGTFGASFGLGLGTIAGLSVGPYLFEHMFVPKKYAHMLSVEADKDRSVQAPEPGSYVTPEMRELLPYTEPWVLSPDYERVSMINRVLAVMWPSLTQAVMAEVIKQVRPQLKTQVFDKFAFIEDIVLGTTSMKELQSWQPYITEKMFTIGTVPPRVGGIKFTDTTADEVILEVPLVWGSNCKFDVGVFLRFGPLRLYLPVEISNVQFKIMSRITIKPLVEEIPCVGGVTIALLDSPHVDMRLCLVKGVDLMALPIVKEAVNYVIRSQLNNFVIHPNSMSFELMKNFGVPEPPKGALNIKLLRAEGLKGDETYVRLEVRKGRPVYSRTVRHTKNPEYNQEFNVIVDDLISQRLDLTVYDDDLGWNDTPIAAGHLTFGEITGSTQDPVTGKFDDQKEYKDFIKAPMREMLVAIPLGKPYQDEMGDFKSAKSIVRSGSKTGSSFMRKLGGSSRKKGPDLSNAMGTAAPSPSARKGEDPGAQEPRGTIYLKVTYLPFLQPQYDDEETEEQKRQKNPKRITPALPEGRTITSNVSDQLRGVLTVNLVRCINLKGDDPTTYVRLIVTDDESDQDQEMKTKCIVSENSPRFSVKFDFVMVRAASHLHITVFRRASLAANVLNSVNVFSKKKPEDKDKPIGRLSLPVKDAAQNGFIKDTWTLEDTEHGSIELSMSWQTCEIPEM